MTYDPDKHKRRSIRLRRYDYAQAGAYFVTVVTQHRACLFGEVVEDEMRLNGAGEMITSSWQNLPNRFPFIQLDTFIVMPNHVHGVIVLEGDYKNRPINDQPVGAGLVPALPTGDEARAPTRGAPTLGEIVGTFKSLTTHTYIQGVRNKNWTPFDKRLWQRNYYEHVIRSEDSLNETRRYIDTNPQRWLSDLENPNGERGRLQESPLRGNRD